MNVLIPENRGAVDALGGQYLTFAFIFHSPYVLLFFGYLPSVDKAQHGTLSTEGSYIYNK